ncbi:hypothetical protein Nepgr_016679 [Nepenthes gracilis]|uniref:Uncharacterized protein n=1 Tax=Nepenthes gracilis TaxID=150966 RepID=A0AAD3SN43_NEPGR|nr:hypothetical protein Nepgr_016679 [Nepenthes gracilis]
MKSATPTGNMQIDTSQERMVAFQGDSGYFHCVMVRVPTCSTTELKQNIHSWHNLMNRKLKKLRSVYSHKSMPIDSDQLQLLKVLFFYK